jgi:hypothetical protein
MTNFERKKKNGALDALRGHRTRILAGIFADIGSSLAVGQLPSRLAGQFAEPHFWTHVTGSHPRGSRVFRPTAVAVLGAGFVECSFHSKVRSLAEPMLCSWRIAA